MSLKDNKLRLAILNSKSRVIGKSDINDKLKDQIDYLIYQNKKIIDEKDRIINIFNKSNLIKYNILNKSKKRKNLYIRKNEIKTNIRLNYLIKKRIYKYRDKIERLNNINILVKYTQVRDPIWGKEKEENKDKEIDNWKNYKFHKEIRSTWKIRRKIDKKPYKEFSNYYKNKRYHKKRNSLITHKAEFSKDINFLYNQFKSQYIKEIIIKSGDININLNNEEEIKRFIWQSKYFMEYLRNHPPLVDHIFNSLFIIKKLKYKKNYNEELYNFLTRFWIAFYDYIYHLDNKKEKGKGMRILLGGRINFQKKGRARKHSISWGICKSAHATKHLQYTSSQITSKLGAMGMRIFIH